MKVLTPFYVRNSFNSVQFILKAKTPLVQTASHYYDCSRVKKNKISKIKKQKTISRNNYDNLSVM